MDVSAFAENPAIRRLIGIKMANEKKYPAQCETARQDCLKQILSTLEAWRKE